MSMLFNENAKLPLIKGVNLIGDAVATTFGPNGKNVVIKNKGGIHITKDGATVARYVIDENPAIMMGVEMVRDIATKTAKDVGDGTSTATILAQAIVNELKDLKENPIQISRDLEEDCVKVIEYLESIKKDISSYEDLVKVATLSANNDAIIGKLIADAYDKVGKHGIVDFEESADITDSIEYTDGMQIESGYASPYFINTDKNTCELENVLVKVFDEKLTELKQVIGVADEAVRNNKALLIIAPKIESQILRFLILNNDKLKAAAVVSPNHGLFRDVVLNDLKVILGNSMTCEKVTLLKDSTIFSGCNSDKEACEIQIQDINNKLNVSTLSEFEKIFHKKRLANYVGGVAVIKIGGYSKIEIIEKKDRVEDAIAAVKAALDGGVLPGGGLSLFHSGSNLELKYLTKILDKPLRLLIENSNTALKYNNNPWTGTNFKTGDFGDMYEMGVIDPFLVTKTALQNAVSAASLILTNGCLIFNME